MAHQLTEHKIKAKPYITPIDGRMPDKRSNGINDKQNDTNNEPLWNMTKLHTHALMRKMAVNFSGGTEASYCRYLWRRSCSVDYETNLRSIR